MNISKKFKSRQWFLTIIALIVIAIWGETFVSSKVLLGAGLMPADIFLYRFTLAYIGMSVISHKRMFSNSFKDELMLVVCGITGGSLYFLTENMALKFSMATNVAIIMGITPLLTALLLACFYKDERMNARQLLGSLMAFGGLVMVVLNGHFELHLNPLGDVLALGAAFTWAMYTLFVKPLSRRYDASFITRKVFGYGVLTILPWYWIVDPLNANVAILTQPVVWGNLLWLGSVASLGCYLTWNWVMPRLGVVKSTNLLYSQIGFTLILTSTILHERVTWMAILGAAILISGMVMCTNTPQGPTQTGLKGL